MTDYAFVLKCSKESCPWRVISVRLCLVGQGRVVGSDKNQMDSLLRMKTVASSLPPNCWGCEAFLLPIPHDVVAPEC